MTTIKRSAVKQWVKDHYIYDKNDDGSVIFYSDYDYRSFRDIVKEIQNDIKQLEKFLIFQGVNIKYGE